MKILLISFIIILCVITEAFADSNIPKPTPSPSTSPKKVLVTPTPAPLIEIKNNDQALNYGGYSKNLGPNHFSFNIQYGDFTNTRSFGGEIEYRGQKWGLGLIAEGSTVSDITSDVSLSGKSYGLIGHLYSLPYWYSSSKNVIAPGIFFEIGDMKFQQTNQDAYSNYLFGSIGVDVAYRVFNHTNLYSKVGLDYIANSEIQYLGTELNIGLRFDF
jgi:hypothetical protein